MDIISFDDVDVRLDMIAVIARVIEQDGDKFSYFIQTAFGKFTKFTDSSYDVVELHRNNLISKLKNM